MSNRKTADWEPGTLDKTRKAIGNIEPHEAAAMAKKLGGEVLNERSTSTSLGRRPSGIGQRAASSGNGAKAASSAPPAAHNSIALRNRRKNELPSLSPKLCAQIDKLMMSNEYQIKANYGFFNFIRKFQKDGTERIIQAFYEVTLKMYIDNLEAFVTVIKTLIQVAPSTYKAKIVNSSETKFKFLRMVAGWMIQPIKIAYMELQELPPPLLVVDLMPLVRAIYQPLMMVYYYGSSKIPKLIKEIYADEASYPDSNKEKLSSLAKEAITEWLYLETEVIKKLYPLLMRMCSDTFESYPDFFTAKVADILQFVGLHKFDLLLPDKSNDAPKAAEAVKKPVVREIKGKRDEIVNTGINLLERLFPQAGFTKLDSRPDFFPYFQPLYKFDEGFNMLSPVNPMQTIIVLLRIIEDFFHGCRDIHFLDSGKVDEPGKKSGDSITAVLDDWSAYRETVFQKIYCDPLKNLVNQVYSQSDFDTSAFGKKLMTTILWQTNYQFLPNFKFEPLVLERPTNDSKYAPLHMRTDFVRKYLSDVVRECDIAAPSRGSVKSIQNPWAHYSFVMPNEISKRLDVLLGAQNTTENTNANNANLLKYTLCVIAVLDWFINNPESPAYTAPPMQIYRISEEDGKPQFSVPERHDQNKLFAEEIRKAYQKQ
ncbi:MAG: hypothetical protein IJR50_00735 [Treponema sp.]|nr:hypothetical protein [Treponema sp.]